MARSPRRHDPVPLSLNVSEPLSGTSAAHKHWQLPRTYGSPVRLQRRLTMAKFYGTHEKGGCLMTACTQPGCTGRIVDGYCDVCGSPAGAAPLLPAESAASVGVTRSCR